MPPLRQPRTQTTALPHIYPAPNPAPHPSPPGAGAFGLPGHGHGHPMTPPSGHEASETGYWSPPAALGPGSDGFMAELAFYLWGEESGERALGFM